MSTWGYTVILMFGTDRDMYEPLSTQLRYENRLFITILLVILHQNAQICTFLRLHISNFHVEASKMLNSARFHTKF